MKTISDKQTALYRIEEYTEEGIIRPAVSAHAQQALRHDRLPFQHVSEWVKVSIQAVGEGLYQLTVEQ